MNVNALTKNLSELGTKIQTGAAGFAEKHELEKKVQPLKEKAGALTAKAGEAIANATKGKAKEEGQLVGGDGAAAERSMDDSEEPKLTKMNSVRESISGLTAKTKAKLEEVSIGEILTKAKSKVFGADGAASVSESADPAVRTQSFEEMKEDVDDLASQMEDTGKDNSNKKDVQKLLVPILSRLKVAQDKFAAMMEARKKKKEEEAAAAKDAGEGEEGKPPNKLLNNAATEVKKAFENAEKIARKVARKAGILDHGNHTEAANTEEAAETAPKEEEESATATEEEAETTLEPEPKPEPKPEPPVEVAEMTD